MLLHKIIKFFRNLSIRSKLLAGYLTAFTVFFLIGGTLLYHITRNTIEANIESQLNNSTKTILNMVKSTADASIRNYLRAVAEKNKDIVTHFYRMYRRGIIGENEAKQLAASSLLSQRIGTTGYIYCIDSKGIMQVHPVKAVVYSDLSKFDFVKKQQEKKEGYIEYDWKNPGELKARPKALYMTYFREWDWIISASSYREEFITLININDFKDKILSLKFGNTGYSYIIDPKGNIVIHPILTGNIYEAQDTSGRKSIQEICEHKNGKIIYSWKNPGEKSFREKVAIFNYIPEFDWIVVSTSYNDEFYGPLKTIKQIIIIMLAASVIFLFLLTYLYSSYFLKTLKALSRNFQLGISGDYTTRMVHTNKDEFEVISEYFNKFMKKFQDYNKSLRDEITERKKSENELKNSQRRLADLIDFLPEATFAIDLEGKVIIWNRTAEEYTGVKRENIIGKGNYEYAIPFYGERRPLLVDIALNHDCALKEKYPFLKFDNETVTGENYVKTPTKGQMYILGIASPLYDAEGNISGAIESIRDISERKQSEESLESVLRAATSYSIIGVDKTGIIKLFNDGAEIMLGYNRDEIVDKFTPVIFHDQDEIAAHAKEIHVKPGIEALIAPAKIGKTETREWTYIKKDKTRITVVLTIAAMKNKAGAITGYIGIARDITSEKNMEQQLLQSQKMESIGHLAGGIAHDFNNLLTPILGYAEIVHHELDENDSRSKFLMNIVHAATQAKDLTRQLLAFSRKQIIELKIVDLGAILEKIEPMLRRMIRENIELNITAEPVSPVRADKGQIEQVLLNLAVNAQDAMINGGMLSIKIRETVLDNSYCDRHPEVKPGAYVMVSFSDTGIGMSTRIINHIFEPFYTTKPAGKGTGLGLSTVYGIIKQHEGSITVYSEENVGSTFKIFIPAITDNPESTATQATGPLPVARGTETILIAEDNEMVGLLAKQMLESIGYRVFFSKNLNQSKIHIIEHENEIDLLLTDVIMPNVNGKELYNELKKINPGLKVLFMSGYTSDVISHHGILDEGTDFIHKPFSLNSLAGKVREILDRK